MSGTLSEDDVIDLFRKAGAILEGHFILSSGLRSPVFIQNEMALQDGDLTEQLCHALAHKIDEADLGPIDLIVSPAVGGIVPGYETARQLGIPAVWVEREAGEFRLRRFDMPPKARVLIVEDIVTTGLSGRETVAAVEALGATVVACACLIDRSGGEASLGVPLISLARYKVPAYAADQIPPEMAAIPAVKPGSRGLA